ncbi:MAG: RNA-binding S4 domain-containing protein [Ekhidna sp.]
MIFKLEGHEYIELNKLLKIMQLVGSGGEAKQFIDEGLVQVNGQVEKQRRKKLRVGDKVSFEGQEVAVE